MTAALDISTVLNHYGADLTRASASGWRPIKCPFHDDRIASASVSLERGAFACHACGMKGDAIALIERNENTDFRGAIEWADKILDASLPDVRKSASRAAPKDRSAWRDRLFD